MVTAILFHLIYRRVLCLKLFEDSKFRSWLCFLYPPPLVTALTQTLTVLCNVVTDWLSGKHRDGSVHELPQPLNRTAAILF